MPPTETPTADILAQMAAGMPGAITTTGTTPATPGGEVPVPAPGQVTGSFDEMSPEQVLAEAHRLATVNAELVASEGKWKTQSRKHERDLKTLRASIPNEAHTGPAATATPSGADASETDRLRQENLRLTVAIEKNLPATLANRLIGDDKDELLEDADRLLALVTPPAPVPTLPRGSADGGAGIPPKAVQTQTDAFVAALNQAIHG